jgi:hypothetical protein
MSPPADAAMPGRRAGRGFRFRVHIATLFVALVAMVGLTIVGYGYVATSHILLAAGDEEFADVAARTASQVRDLLAPALLLVQLVARHPITTAPTMSARWQTLPMLTAAMTEHPEISAVYVGRDNGDFFLARTLGGAVGPGLGAPPDARFLVQIRAGEDPAGDGTSFSTIGFGSSARMPSSTIDSIPGHVTGTAWPARAAPPCAPPRTSSSPRARSARRSLSAAQTERASSASTSRSTICPASSPERD